MHSIRRDPGVNENMLILSRDPVKFLPDRQLSYAERGIQAVDAPTKDGGEP